MIEQNYQLDFVPGSNIVVVHVSQYDVGRKIYFQLFMNGETFSIPNGTTFTIDGTKPDKHAFSYHATLEQPGVSFETTRNMCAVAGKVVCQLRATYNGDNIGTADFILDVERAGIADDADTSTTEIPAYIDAARENAEAAAQSATNAAQSAGNAAQSATDAAAAVTSASQYAGNAQASAAQAAASAALFTTGIIDLTSRLKFQDVRGFDLSGVTVQTARATYCGKTTSILIEARLSSQYDIYVGAGGNAVWPLCYILAAGNDTDQILVPKERAANMDSDGGVPFMFIAGKDYKTTLKVLPYYSGAYRGSSGVNCASFTAKIFNDDNSTDNYVRVGAAPSGQSTFILRVTFINNVSN